MSFQNCKILSVGGSADDYHAAKGERGSPNFKVSPSMLSIFGQCAARWRAGYEPPSSEAKSWGNLLDGLWLTPESFKARFAVKPATYPSKEGEKPFNANSTWCRNWIDEQGDKQIVSKSEVSEAQAAILKLDHDEVDGVKLIRSVYDQSDKQVHVFGEWHDELTRFTVPVECLIDLAPKAESEFASCLADLKSTRNAGLNAFQRWAYQANYHVQAAFDLDLYSAATGEARDTWLFILQENYPPWTVGRRMLSQDFIQIGRQTYQDLLSRYCRCLKTNVWPSYDDHPETVQGWSLVEPMLFMEYQALSESLERNQKSALEEEPVDVPMP